MDKATAYRLYEPMLKTRRVDERMRRLFRQGRFKGTYFSAVGQEATNVGAGIHMGPDDMLAPSHRQLGAMIAKGISLKRVMAQVYSKAESPDGSHQHPCHFGDPDLNIVSPTGHVAIQVVMGAGSAYGFLLEAAQAGQVKINWDPEGIVWAGRWSLNEGARLRCALSFFGEGATAKGDFHESLNFAAIHKLPIVYICENNLWAESVHYSENFTLDDFSERAKGYGMPGVSIDGNDIFAVHDNVGAAVERARTGGGPTLVECKTYRWHGHSEIDPADYRTDEELEGWKERCPLEVFRRRATEMGVWDDALSAAAEERIAAEIDEAIDWAEEEATEPDPENFLGKVFHTPELNAAVRRAWERHRG